jgi:hypothetical protein
VSFILIPSFPPFVKGRLEKVLFKHLIRKYIVLLDAGGERKKGLPEWGI